MIETLFPYQLTGADWLATTTQALLADEMGLGKSAQAVRACDLIGAKNILVVCLPVARVNWLREFWRFSPLDRESKAIMSGKDVEIGNGVTVVSYDMLVSSPKLLKAVKAKQWCALIIDEAHSLKERTTKRTKALYGHNQHPGIMHKADRCWRLTGTPMPNTADELYTHLKSAGLWKESYWDFVFTFCDGFNSDYGFKITGVKNADRLRELLSKFMLRRKKAEVMSDLPDIVFQNVTVERSHVDLDPYFFANYYGIGIDEFLKELKTLDTSIKTAITASRRSHNTTSSDLLHILAGFNAPAATLRRYLGLAKVPAVVDILTEELDSNKIDKIVVFAVHAQVIEELRKRLAKFKPVTLFGGTPAAKRQKNIDKFQKDPRCRVFIGQILSAGTSITLTTACEMAFIEQDWVPGNNAQAAMRIHRLGQTRKCRARFFSCANSMEDHITDILIRKTRDIAKVID